MPRSVVTRAPEPAGPAGAAPRHRHVARLGLATTVLVAGLSWPVQPGFGRTPDAEQAMRPVSAGHTADSPDQTDARNGGRAARVVTSSRARR